LTSLSEVRTLNPLYNDIDLRNAVLSEAIPLRLLELLGLPTVLKRVPETYARAVYSSYLASRFVYRYGLSASDLSFFEYMQFWMKSPPKKIQATLFGAK